MQMTKHETIWEEAKSVSLKLLAYCRAAGWAGYDPYDALNSQIIAALPFLDFRLSRLALTQALKRSPINVRRLLLIPKTQNPKALALFLTAFVKLSKLGMLDRQENLAEGMIDRIAALRSPDLPYWCWGYSFPWQTRWNLISRATPNLVCTSFVANALLDAYDRCNESRCLNMAVSAAEYILNELYWTEGSSTAGFSYFGYPFASMRSSVHNVNFLGAALLCRVYQHLGVKKFLDAALRVAHYSAGQQHEDGSWHYGEASTQRWIDNFHTGYNLCALQSVSRSAPTTGFDSHIRRGFDFYRTHFFCEDGAPRYFHDRTYPIDIHSAAQSIITLLALSELHPDNLALASSVFRWAMKHMWDDRGFFYYRVLRPFTIRTPYMRWSQAWMLLALSTLLLESNGAIGQPNAIDAATVVKTC